MGVPLGTSRRVARTLHCVVWLPACLHPDVANEPYAASTGLRIMKFSTASDSPQDVLLERMRKLHDRQDDKPPHSAEYKRLSEEIRELSKAYGTLADAMQGIERPDPKR